MITAIGNPVYDHIVTPKITTSERVLSGCSTNAVLALAKLGEQTRIIGAIGPDYKATFEADMQRRGIASILTPSERTGGFALHYYDEFGSRTLRLIDRAADIPSPQHAWYADSAAVLIGPILGEVSFDAIRQIRKDFTGLFFCDPQGLLRGADPEGNIFHEKPKGIEEVLALFNVVKPNELEAEILTGVNCRQNPHRAAEILHSWGCKIVFITLAELGAIVYDGREMVHVPPVALPKIQDIPAYPVNLMDATGAGDTSMAGFTFEFLRTGDITQAACFAAATSSYKIEGSGPNFPIVEQHVRKRAETLMEKVRAGYRFVPQPIKAA
ncbi:MAG: PfkB family carbohydrate kinase [Patescibacteria group bacterium]